MKLNLVSANRTVMYTVYTMQLSIIPILSHVAKKQNHVAKGISQCNFDITCNSNPSYRTQKLSSNIYIIQGV